MTETTPRSGSLTPPFLLYGNERIWRVISGGVDVFLVDLSDGQPAGARRHVFRVPAGEALLGLPPAACLSAGLLACPLPGAVVESVAPEDLPLPLLEKWIDSLSQALAQQASPPPSRWVEAGALTSIEEAPSLLRTRGDLCWLCHRAGQSVYLGVPELSLNGSGWFPLSSAAWIEASAGSVLEAVNSSDWLSADPEGAGVDEFHRMAVVTLIRQRSDADRKERERLSIAVEREAGVVGSALRQLASPLQTGTAQVEEDEGGPGGDPLLLACQAVARSIGVRLRAPLGRQAGDRIAAIARASGVRVRRVALRDRWWRENAGPMLAFRSDDKRPVALLNKDRRYRLWDPMDHTTTRVGRKASASLEPFAWIFYRPFPERSLSLYDLLIFGLRGARRDLTAILLMGIGSGLLAVLTPLATALIFDQLIPGADRTGITAAALFLAVAAVVSALFGLTSNYAVLRMEGRMESATQAAVWDRLLGLPVPFFRDFDSGDLAMRSLGISEIRAALTGSTISSVLSGIFSVFSLALMFYYSLPLALLGLGLSVIAFVVPTLAGAAQVKRYRVLSTVRGRISGMLLQFLGGIAKLRVTGKEVRAFSAWAGEFTRQKREATAARKLSNLLAVFTSSFPLLSIAAIFYVNSALAGDSKFASLTTGQFLAFYAAFFGFLNAGLELSSAVVSVLGIVPLFERARPILATLPEVSAAKSYPGELTGAIEVSHVFFRYRRDLPLVLNGLSLKVHAGEFVALVGASGCGKSTLMRLLLGFEQPESGSIHFDGQDLAGLDLPAVRRQIGVVLQNGKLQTGDIFQNIIGALPLTIDDAWEAARQAGLDEEIRAMPMGMYTVLSEGGGGLSGGQRQRLMIARAIVAKPRMLLFDEATSALDNQTQAIVSRSLEALKATRIVIAHRLSTIVNADRIYVVDAGTVAEEGTYEVLLQKDGLFAKLAKRQLI
jgi:NHLM bacteriocin system ABC transporter ATP-binding protein